MLVCEPAQTHYLAAVLEERTHGLVVHLVGQLAAVQLPAVRRLGTGRTTRPPPPWPPRGGGGVSPGATGGLAGGPHVPWSGRAVGDLQGTVGGGVGVGGWRW